MEKFKNKKVALLGLGIEGKDALNFLSGKGALITLFDRKSEKDLDFEGVNKDGIKLSLGEDYLKEGLLDFDFIVRSPGIYRYIPEIVEAEKNGVEVTSAIKIFFDECPAKIIGVTGTKGKGTTSTLIYEILSSAGKEVYLSGNIGKPYLNLLPALGPTSYIVMEMSSFQLIDMEKSPDIAVVLNITTDHLDWHRDRDEYVSAKESIVKFQKPNDFKVINGEYETSRNFVNLGKGKTVLFSKEKLEEKYKENLLLRGEHNLENIAAAVEVGRVVGISEEIILKAVKSFKGLEHRLELVDEIGGVTFYNDSFATSPQPTIAAINSFTEPETLILGGSDKGLDYRELADGIEKRKNVKNIILIGDTARKIKDALENKNLKVKIYELGFMSMEKIVKKAHQVSEKGSVVVLSPASASFDMFKNYKERGNQFKAAVENLKA